MINGERVFDRIDELNDFIEMIESKSDITESQKSLLHAAKSELSYLNSLYI